MMSSLRHLLVCLLLVLTATSLPAQTPVRHALPLRVALGGMLGPNGFQSEPGQAQSLFTHRLPNSVVDSFWCMAGGGDEFFRYTDLNLGHSSVDQVRTLNRGYREFGKLFEGLKKYDVFACQGLPQVWQQANEGTWWGSEMRVEPEATGRLHQALREWLEAGGTWLLTGELPKVEAGSPLEPVLGWKPAAEPQTGPHVAFAGMPVEVFPGYGNLKLAAPEGGQVVTRRQWDGKPGPAFAALWPLGKGMVVHVGLPVATGYTATPFAIIGKDTEVDTDEVSMRLMEQVWYAGKYHAQAYPAVVDLPEVKEPVAAGTTFGLPAVVTATPPAPLKLALEVVAPGPGGVVEWSSARDVTPAANEEIVTLEIPIPVNWPAGKHLLKARLLSADGKQLFHEAWTPITVAPGVELKLASDQLGYKFGAPVALTADLTSALDRPLAGRVRLAVYDFHGRALYADSKPVTLAAGQNTSVGFAWKLPVTGWPEYTFWARAELLTDNDKTSWGTVTAKFYRFERWDTRNQLNWGLCSAGQLEDGPGIPAMYRQFLASGFNSINWTPPLAFSERVGWMGDTQDMMYVNTFSPQWVPGDEEEIARGFRANIAHYMGRAVPGVWDPRSPAICVRSVGEEGGYGPGWGTVWEWKEEACPNPVAVGRFHQYLQTMYPTIADLNRQWDTNFGSWDEVKLEKQYTERPENLYDRNKAPLAQRNHSRWTDTRNFFDWYYQWWVDIAVRTVREFSPVPLYTYSTGNAFNVQTELVAENSLWNRPDMPSYTLSWLQFPSPAFMRDLFWKYAAAHIGQMSGYTPNWILNYDMTLSQASLANLQFMAGAGRVYPALLQANPYATPQFLVYQPPNKRLQPPADLVQPLMMAGFPQPAPYKGSLEGAKVLLCPFALRMSPQQAAQIKKFVADGGTLIATQWFAVEDEHGKMFAESPGLGLQEVLGVKQSETHEWKPRRIDTTEASAPLPPGLTMYSEYCDTGAVALEGTTQLVSFDQGLPAITVHSYGKGKAYWLNIGSYAYWAPWRIAYPDGYTLTPGQTLQRILAALAADAGLNPAFALEDSQGRTPAEVYASLFTGSDGQVRYLVIGRAPSPPSEGPRFDGECVLRWLRPGCVAYDPAEGKKLAWAPGAAGVQKLSFHLDYGQGRVLAILPYEVGGVTVEGGSAVKAGEPLTVKVAVQAKAGATGEHVVEITARDARGNESPAYRRVLRAKGATTVTLPTAVNDPAGEWTITATDLATGLAGSRKVTLQASPVAKDLPGLTLAWPSERVSPRVVSDEQFLNELERLSQVYLTEGGDRFALSFYQQWHGDTRHNLATKLAAVDWREHSAALRRYLEGGGTVVLTGEDLGRHPFYGVPTYPHNDGHQLEALAKALAGARMTTCANRPSLLVFSVGRGKLALDRDSWDEHIWRMQDFTAWQRAWLADYRATAAQAGGAAVLGSLADWFSGKSPVPASGEVTAFADHQSEAVARFGANERENTIAVAVPAGSRIKSATLEVVPEPDVQAYPNPGMEEGDEKTVAGWYLPPFGPGSGPDTTVFHGGKRSLKLVGKDQPTTSYGPSWTLRDYVPPCADMPLTVGLWVKGENVKGASFGWASVGTGPLIGKPLPEGTYDWQRVELSATAARLPHAGLQLTVALTGGTLWIDDLESLPPTGVNLTAGPVRTPVWQEGGALNAASLTAALNQAVAVTAADPDGRVRLPLGVHAESMGAVRLRGLKVVVTPLG